MTRAYNYHRALAVASGSEGEVRRAAELAALVEHSLGRPLEPTKFADLEQIQAKLWSTEDALNAQLESGTLTPDDYLDCINASIKTSMDCCLSLLGDHEFDAIFGEAGRHPECLIDRETFLKELGHENP